MNKPTIYTQNQLSFSLQNNRRTISGYAAVYFDANNPGTTYSPQPNVALRIARGAFDQPLKSGQPIAALYNHDDGSPLGDTQAGNLTLEADFTGLKFSLTLPNTTLGNDVWELVGGNGGPAIIRGCSFSGERGFDKWTKEGETDVLTFYRWASISEITICKNPAFTATSISWSDEAAQFARHERFLMLAEKYTTEK